MSDKKVKTKKAPSSSPEPTAEPSSSEASAVKQKLFILKSSPKGMKNAEQFLKNRDFIVVSTTDVKMAINDILSGQASYIMLSADHNNPKVMKLPAIIKQTFNTPVILFSEGLSPRGAISLRESGHPYVLYPPVSGPAVERMILKIERDKKEKTEEAQNSAAFNGGNDGASSVHVKSGAVAAKSQDDVISQTQKAQQEFAKIFAGETSGANSDFSFNLTAESGLSPHQSSAAYMGSAGSVAQQGDAEAVRDYLNQEGIDPSTASTHMPKQSAGGPANSAQATANSLTDGTAGESEASQSSLLPKFIGQNKKGDMYIPPKGGGEIKTSSLAEFQSTQAGAPHLTGLSEGSINQAPLPNEVERAPGASLITFKTDENSSFLIKGAQHAVDRSSRFVTGKNIKKVQSCTRVGCFNIQSSRFAGYVIVAFGEKDKLDMDFNKNIQRYLFEYLKMNGIEVKVEELVALKINEVNFEEWSIKEADFLMTSVHEGNEIALAFFPHEKKEAPLEVSAQVHMAKMTIDEIKPDEPVEFDVYIYLPANEKYVRYTAKNGIMYSSQKNRLKTRGHDKIHIRKESESDLSRYRVQNFLNDKIAHFRSRKTA